MCHRDKKFFATCVKTNDERLKFNNRVGINFYIANKTKRFFRYDYS